MSADQSPTPVIATITGADLLNQLNSLGNKFGEMSAKLDDIPRQVRDHETRIRALERRLWMAAGAAAAAGTIVGWVLQQMGR